jgi:hypothetical protein
MGYGKSNPKKVFALKHFLKKLICESSLALSKQRGSAFYVASDSDMDFCRSKTNYPPSSASYSQYCDRLLATPFEVPKEACGNWHGLMGSKLFSATEAVAFFPLYTACLALGAAAKAGQTFAEALKQISPIKIHKRGDGNFYLHEKGVALGMKFDPNMSCRFGLACAEKHKLCGGGFRVASKDVPGEIGSTLTLHPFEEKDGEARHMSISHRGVTYLSSSYLERYYEQLNAERQESEKVDAEATIEVAPWLHSDAPATTERKRAPVAAGAGGLLAAGLLGAAAGATVASAARPYGYGYGYGYPPYGYYPPPPPPYWYRRRRW